LGRKSHAHGAMRQAHVFGVSAPSTSFHVTGYPVQSFWVPSASFGALGACVCRPVLKTHVSSPF